MSLIKIDSNYPETSTRFIGMSFDLTGKVISQYMQSFNGKDVARFKVYERHPFLIHKPRKKYLLWDTNTSE